jgi:ABC-type Mn2+/Zn2+ transport system ATPase subunit
MIRLEGVSFSYGEQAVLTDINFTIASGELAGIIGPSGSGKTTLLRILLGELRPTVGQRTSDSNSGVAVGYVPQLDPSERSFPLTVEEMVLLGRAAFSRRRPWFDRSEKNETREILNRLGIGHLSHRRLDELSGGQFQRALIARALLARPQLLLLDEPTSGIDLNTRQSVLQLIDELRADGYAVVVTTHDLNWVAAHLPRIVCLNERIVADGAPLDVLNEDVVAATYGARMDVFVHNGRPVVVDPERMG